MTPEILKAISSIVNKELIPQPLSELNDPEGTYQTKAPSEMKEKNPQDSEASTAFKQALSKMDWKDALMKSTSRYKYINPRNVDDMEPLTYMKNEKNDQSVIKVNNQSVRNNLKAGDYIFKDTNGEPRSVAKTAIERDYRGTVGSTLEHRKNKLTKAALYRGADVEFRAGSKIKTLKSGQYLIKDGDNFTNLSIADFNKNFELKKR